jgi:murein DD-endopeptidase MepM/ murein hydrolase activator NlpD
MAAGADAMSALAALTLWRFAGASVIGVAVAALLYLMLAMAARRWPALAARRSPWLLAQAAVVAAFALALVPPTPLPGGALITVHSDALALALAPADEVSMPLARTGVATAVASARSQAPSPSVDAAAPRRAAGTTQVLAALVPSLASGWLLVYAAGVLWRGLRGARNHLRWRVLLASARRLDATALHQHGAFSASQLARLRERSLTVLETAAPVSPMLLGALRPRLVLPRSLRGLNEAQQHLIVAHELAHWRRHDTLWLAVAGTLQAAFWFNLPLRWLTQGLHRAVELGCDNAVLAGRSSDERRTYAAALVAQLRQQHTAHAGVPAFGALAVRERIERMRQTTMPRLPALGALMLAAAGSAIVAASVLLQPAFAARGGAAAAQALATPQAGASAAAPRGAEPAQPWRYPLDHVVVSSLYGVVSARLPEGHRGIDLRAKRGTAVRAVAAGTVIESAFDAAYGNYVRIDHGDGRQSLSIHLDSRAVRVGDALQAGQRIGAVGDTGKASGPHLHLEYWRDGQRQDPTLMLPELDQRATPSALARRAAQTHPI